VVRTNISLRNVLVINIIKEKCRNKKKFLENFFSLSLLQGANYILPLITVPYLVRTIGIEKFGLISFASALTAYFVMLSDFGFCLSATRDIAVHREDSSKVSEIFCSVMIIKFVLIILCSLILLSLVFFVPRFKMDWYVYVLTFGMVIGHAVFPTWFFQGMEEMKYITILNVTAKSIFTASIIIFIRQPSQFYFVPIFNSSGFIIAGVIAQYLIYRKFKVRLYIPKLRVIIDKLKDSSQFFLSRVSASIFTTSNAFVLGLLTSNEIVGLYVAAEKIFVAFQQLYQPLNDVLYPYIAKERNLGFFRKIFYLAVSLNLLIATFVFIFSGSIVQLIFGSGFEITADILRIFSLTLVIVVPTVLLGYPYLAAMGFAKYANLAVVYASIIHLAGLLILAYYSLISPYTVAYMVLITQSCILSFRLYGIKKSDLMKYLYLRGNFKYEPVKT
jgi:polysaccharide transporter, PST family